MSLNNWETTFKNDSGETIPPFACMRVKGVEALSGNRIAIKMGKPDTYGSQLSHYINGPIEVANGKYGSCTNVFPAIVKAGSGTLTNGTLWGPRSGGWTIEKETGGFVVVSEHSSGFAIVNRLPMLAFTGRFDADVAQGATGTVSVYWHGSDTGQNITGVYAVSQAFVTTDDVNAMLLNERWEAYCRTA